MKSYILGFLLSLLFQYSHSSLAQIDSLKRSDVSRFTKGVVHNLTSPLRWDRKDWAHTGVLLLSTAAISCLDVPVNNFWHGKSDPTLDAINDIGFHYGKPYSAIIATGGFYLTGIIIKNEWARETGLILGTSLMTSGIIMSVLKPVIGRSRPEVDAGNYDFHPFTGLAKFHSLPSGHVAIALTISLVLAKRVQSTPLKIFFYSLAASTIFCRLYSDAHWLSDEALAGGIAWFSASQSINQFSNPRYKRHTKTTVSLRPSIGGASLKITLN